MRAIGWTILGVIVVVLLLSIGILAGQVGGIAIRKQGAEADALLLQVSEPVLRGVPVMVRWTSQEGSTAEVITFTWRDRSTDYDLGEAQLKAHETALKFPCVGLDTSGSLVVRVKSDGKVLGTRTVELGAAGPECI